MKTASERHLAQASVGLAGQAGDAPAGDNALCSATLGDGDGVDHLVGLEDGVHGHRLLKELVRKVHLVLDAATIDLHDAHTQSVTAAEICSRTDHET